MFWAVGIVLGGIGAATLLAVRHNWVGRRPSPRIDELTNAEWMALRQAQVRKQQREGWDELDRVMTRQFPNRYL